MRAALPAVVFDECLWWLVSKSQDLFARKASARRWGDGVWDRRWWQVCALPMTLDLVVLPFLDFLHMVPVITKARRDTNLLHVGIRMGLA